MMASSCTVTNDDNVSDDLENDGTIVDDNNDNDDVVVDNNIPSNGDEKNPFEGYHEV